MTRLPRIKPGGGGLGRVRRVPQSVGGRRSHPPKGKDYSKKLNKKEAQRALDSAIAASASKELVEARGHEVAKVKEIPLIVSDEIQKTSKTKDLLKALEKLGLGDDLAKAKAKGRKSVLIVVGEDEGVGKAASAVPGVNVVNVAELKVSDIAPGAAAGRLTLWSEGSIKKLTEDGSA